MTRPPEPLDLRALAWSCVALLALAAVACDRSRESAAAAQADACAPRPEDVAALRARLEAELRPRIRGELREELRAEIEADVRRTQTKDAGPMAVADAGSSEPTRPGGDADARTASAPDAAPAETAGGEPSDDDPWSKPGVRIWTSRGGVRLLEVAVGTSLEDKLPVNVKKVYEAMPELLYCYTVFENLSSETTVTHVWRRGSRLVSRVELEVGSSPRWKTWSKQRTQPQWTGLWSCEVLGPEGQKLGLTVFSLGGT